MNKYSFRYNNKKYEIKYPKSVSSDKKEIWKNKELQPSKILQEIFERGIIKMNDEEIKLHSSVSPLEGSIIYNLIRENKMRKSLEIGMANGISTLYFLEGLKSINNEYKHISIDPYQDSQWKGVGRYLVKKSGLDDNHRLLKLKSYIGLPKLLEKKYSFDIIFIDGMHLYDYTLIDLFYSILLCKIGGVIIIDDYWMKSIKDLKKYIDKNYSNFLEEIKIENFRTSIIYIKKSEDNREWNYHKNICE